VNRALKLQPASSTQEVLAGLVERVTYHNAENGFCVLRIKARGHRDLVTAVGHAATIAAGEWIAAAGEWVNDRTHGQQFKSRFMRTSAPTTTEGIEKYLGSGMIRGIGPVYAEKMVKAFGEKVFDVIEAEPDRHARARIHAGGYASTGRRSATTPYRPSPAGTSGPRARRPSQRSASPGQDPRRGRTG
jgi:ATP-dependent exoDNAse (exonuclease V) alpha subunit